MSADELLAHGREAFTAQGRAAGLRSPIWAA